MTVPIDSSAASDSSSPDDVARRARLVPPPELIRWLLPEYAGSSDGQPTDGVDRSVNRDAALDPPDAKAGTSSPTARPQSVPLQRDERHQDD